MTYTISSLAKQFGLSRSTLLYYDKKGLLNPSERTNNNYRIYSQQDYQRLKNIVAWREAGLSLEAIAKLLAQTSDSMVANLLQNQVVYLNEEIQELRKQQRVTLALLQSKEQKAQPRTMNKQQWVELLSSSGMSDEDMWRWHKEFERLMPQAHQDFLESLNISEEEIKTIRRKSQAKKSD